MNGQTRKESGSRVHPQQEIHAHDDRQSARRYLIDNFFFPVLLSPLALQVQKVSKKVHVHLFTIYHEFYEFLGWPW